MSTTKIRVRLPDTLKEAAMRQAAQSGISMNLFEATAVAAQVGARAEAERAMRARGSRTTPARAHALLTRMGTAGTLRDDDRLDLSEAAQQTGAPLKRRLSARNGETEP